jgi:hypothetical protein
MEGVGHLVQLETPIKCVELGGRWPDDEMKGWWKEWDKNKRWRQMSKEEKDKSVESRMAGLK